jgi:formiminotetrahydrofolate cyclodeaminase
VLTQKKVKDFLDEVASKSPAPGGGSTAALSGSLAASLTAMVCHLTLGKQGYQEIEPQVKKTLRESEQIRKKLTSLIDEDTRAFDSVIAAFQMPKTTEKEQQKRRQAIQEGYKRAAAVPLATAQYCDQLWEHILFIAQRGNKNSISDAGVASLLAYAGVLGATLNVKINLVSIKDTAYNKQMNTKIQELEKRATVYQKKIRECIQL